MVGMRVREQHAIQVVDFRIQELLANVGRGINQNARRSAGPAALDQQRAAPPAVLRIVRIAGAPAAAQSRHTGRRTTAQNDEPQAHATASTGCGTLANSRKKFAVVWAAIASRERPRVRASTAAVSTTYAGSLRRPRRGSGARYGASVSTRIRSGGNSAAISRSAFDFLKVSTPENET